MLDGWYCRSLANQGEENFVKDEQESEEEVTPPGTVKGRVPKPHAAGGAVGPSSSGLGPSGSVDPSSNDNVIDYKERYKNLKKKLKFLIYENEYFQDVLHTNQRRLLKVSKDRTFLLDRLLLYEKPAKDSSDSDATDSSDGEAEPHSVSLATPNTSIGMGTSAAGGGSTKETVRRKYKDKEGGATAQGSTGGAPRGRKRKIQTETPTQIHPAAKRQLMATVSPSPSATVSVQLQPQPQPQTQQPLPQKSPQQTVPKDVSVALSTAEITRQLQERRPMMSPECTSATVPATMLSDESPSKCYPHDSFPHLMEDDEVAAEECVPMEYTS
ncbi:uncharacterized protein Dwil_GK20638 [Drosophila willistoni]|uniref:INO80 complex subunit E N-terminal domain-containing protein n=1 Tax=Drosophila willistoni TaxID=7260 RepID=B4MKB7_DROWI|nr:INO80 complex subunit E [Drosophila willistoni]EDW72556.1 uncharacterized protein Dwil_GK20638 [Drosophila willistoni]